MFSSFIASGYSCSSGFTAADVVEIKNITTLNIIKNKRCRIEGRLKINYTDFLSMPYQLTEVKCLGYKEKKKEIENSRK